MLRAVQSLRRIQDSARNRIVAVNHTRARRIQLLDGAGGGIWLARLEAIVLRLRPPRCLIVRGRLESWSWFKLGSVGDLEVCF